MKRNAFLMGLLALCCTPGFAQDQLENPGFEEWEDIATSPTDTIREPVQWSSLKTSDDPALTPLAPVVCARSNEAHTGNHSVKLSNIASFLVANGIVTNGRIHPNITPSLAYTYTDIINEQWHTKFTSRPDSIAGWYMYAPQGNDSLQVKLTLHQGYGQQPEDDEEANWIGVAEFKSGTNTQGVWERFSVPFTYFSEEVPEYVLVVISSGNAYNAIANSAAYFDDLEMIYNSDSSGMDHENNLFLGSLPKAYVNSPYSASVDLIPGELIEYQQTKLSVAYWILDSIINLPSHISYSHESINLYPESTYNIQFSGTPKIVGSYALSIFLTPYIHYLGTIIQGPQTIDDTTLSIAVGYPDTCDFANIVIDSEITLPKCYGGADGSINISVDGFYQGFVYEWSTGSNDEDLIGLSSGVYEVTVTDSEGCSGSKEIQVFDPTPMTINENRLEPLCYGDSTGIVKINVLGGKEPYTYIWDVGSSGDSVSGLSSGCYNIIVHDSNECIYEKEICLSEPDSLELHLTKHDNICNGDSTGVIYVHATGGTPGYQYLWDDPLAQNRNGSLTDGTFLVSVVDENNCLRTDSVTLTDPEKILLGEIVGNDNVEEFLTYTYSLPMISNLTYHWFVEGGNVISGQGTNFVEIQWGSGTEGFVYAVSESDLGCFSDTAVLYIHIYEVGISPESSQEIIMYPNPSDDYTIIHIPTYQLKESIIKISDISGKTVKMLTIQNDDQVRLDIGELQPGFYFVALISDRVYKGKLIIE